jgi:D-cysteine desulfhydrase family pyridoxal phosphate-dependent enzyme
MADLPHDAAMRPLSDFPRVSLALLPTPLYKLPNVSRVLGKSVWIKRDDMTGVALGGNKVRKLEFLLADALKAGAQLVMTTGGGQSNHAMLTAACAFRLGLEPLLLLKKRGVWQCRGNQVLNHLMGAEVRLIDTGSYDDIYAEMDRVGLSSGKKFYKIPCGGSVPLGCLGYVSCMKEIAEQAAAHRVRFDHIVCATGSGGTHAGTALGARLFLPGTRVTGVAVDTDPFAVVVPELMRGTARLLELDMEIHKAEVELTPMWGDGYGIPSKAGNEAVKYMAQNEGVFLDPVYTGKAFAGLLKLNSEGIFDGAENILFLHTGGAGGLFAPDWEKGQPPPGAPGRR